MGKMVKLIGTSIILLTLSLGLGSCATGEKETQDKKETVTIGAAASLNDVFVEKIIPAFEEKYENTEVVANFGGSGTIKMQIEQGSEQDLFFSASVDYVEELEDEGLIDSDSFVYLLENRIVLASAKPPQNETIKSFTDLSRAKVVAMGNPESAPVGKYGQQALEAMGLWEEVASGEISYGNDVSQVVSWIKEGSAEVGLIYQSDAVRDSEHLQIIDVAQGENMKPCIYSLALIDEGKDNEAAHQLFAFLQTPEVKKMFEEYGFQWYEGGAR